MHLSFHAQQTKSLLGLQSETSDFMKVRSCENLLSVGVRLCTNTLKCTVKAGTISEGCRGTTEVAGLERKKETCHGEGHRVTM